MALDVQAAVVVLGLLRLRGEGFHYLRHLGMRAERQADAIAKAKANGAKFGCNRVLSADQVSHIQVLRNEEGMSVPDIAKCLCVGVAMIYLSLTFS
jgi:DNA-binding transcriptional regulator YiaG